MLLVLEKSAAFSCIWSCVLSAVHGRASSWFGARVGLSECRLQGPPQAAPAPAPATPTPTPTSTPSAAPAPSPAPSSGPAPPPAAASTSPPPAVASGPTTNAAGVCASNGGLQGIDCSGGCSTYSAANSVAVNCGGGSYRSTCGVQFLADETPCDPGDVIPAGSPYCRTNIKGPEFGYFYPTDRTVAGTADSTIFQSERIGFNTYKFRVDNGVYSVAVYLAEISGDDPSINVNAEGLRRFTLIFNDDPNSPLQNLDPFKLAGGQKFVACPVQTAQITVTSGILKMQLFPTGIRDAPAIKGVWVHKIG